MANNTEEKLFSQFPPVSTEQWEAAITADLKGADYQKKLVWRTTEGFNASACWLSAQLHSAEAPGCITEALVENEFAGILTLDERRGRERGIGWIAFLYVVPKLRGHHCGIQLVGTAAMRFRQLGRRAMRLTVAPENPALGFYEKAGFVRIGTEAGALGDLLVMEWTL